MATSYTAQQAWERDRHVVLTQLHNLLLALRSNPKFSHTGGVALPQMYTPGAELGADPVISCKSPVTLWAGSSREQNNHHSSSGSKYYYRPLSKENNNQEITDDKANDNGHCGDGCQYGKKCNYKDEEFHSPDDDILSHSARTRYDDYYISGEAADDAEARRMIYEYYGRGIGGSVNKGTYPAKSNIVDTSYSGPRDGPGGKIQEHDSLNEHRIEEENDMKAKDNYYHYVPYNNITANAEWLLKGVHLPCRRYSRHCPRRIHGQYSGMEGVPYGWNSAAGQSLEMQQHPLITAVRNLREKLLLSSTIIDIPQYNEEASECGDGIHNDMKNTGHCHYGNCITHKCHLCTVSPDVCTVSPEELLFPFCLVVLSEETTEAITVVGLAAFVTFLELQCSFLTPEAIILMSECSRNSRSEIVDAQSHEAVLARILHVYVGCCRHSPNGGLIPESHVVALLKSCYTVATHGNPSELLGSIAEQSMNDMVTRVFERIAARQSKKQAGLKRGAGVDPSITTITGEEILEYVCTLISSSGDDNNNNTVGVTDGSSGVSCGDHHKKSERKGNKHNHRHISAHHPYHYRHIFGPHRHYHRHGKNRLNDRGRPTSHSSLTPSSHHPQSNIYYNPAAIQLQGLCLAHTILFLLKETLLTDPWCKPLLKVVRTKLCTALLRVGTTGDNVIVLSQLLLTSQLVVQFASVAIVPQTLRIIYQLHLVPLQQLLTPSYNTNSPDEYEVSIHRGPGGTAAVSLLVTSQGTSGTPTVYNGPVMSYTYSCTAVDLPCVRDKGSSAILSRRGVIMGIGNDINTLASILSGTVTMTDRLPMVTRTVSETHDMILESLLEFCAIAGGSGNISNSDRASQLNDGRRKELLSSHFGFPTFCFVHYDLSLHITNKETLSSIVRFLAQCVLQASVTASSPVAAVLGQMYYVKCGVGSDNKNTLLANGGAMTGQVDRHSTTSIITASAPLLHELHLKNLLSLVDSIPSVTTNVLDGLLDKTSLSNNKNENTNTNGTRPNSFTESYGCCFAETLNLLTASTLHGHTYGTSDISLDLPEQSQGERVTFFPSLHQQSIETSPQRQESPEPVIMKNLKNDIQLNKCYRQERALVFATMIIASGELKLENCKSGDSISPQSQEVKSHLIEVLNSTRANIYRSYASAARACNRHVPIQADSAIPSTANYHQQLLLEQMQAGHLTSNTSVSLLHSDVLQWSEVGLVAFEAMGALIKGLHRRWCIERNDLHRINNNKSTDRMENATESIAQFHNNHQSCHPLHRHISTIAYIKLRLQEFSVLFDNKEWKKALTSLLRADDTSYLERVMGDGGKHRRRNCFGLLPSFDSSDTNQSDNSNKTTRKWSTGVQVGQVLYRFRTHLNRQVLGDFIGELGKGPAKPSLSDAVFDLHREYDPVIGENKTIGYKNKDERDALIARYQADLLDVIEKTPGMKQADVTDEEINAFRIKEWERSQENDRHVPHTIQYMAGILKGFMMCFKFAGKPLLNCVREFVFEVGLPGEAQKIDRVMEAFSSLWFQSNTVTNEVEKTSTDKVNMMRYYDDSTSDEEVIKEQEQEQKKDSSGSTIIYNNLEINPFKGPDAAFILSFSIIMLNTDLHSGKLSKTMKQEEFLSMNRGIDEGRASLPDSYLNAIYESVYANQIVMLDMFQVQGVVNSSVWDLLERQALDGEGNGYSREERRSEISRILTKLSDIDRDSKAERSVITSQNNKGDQTKNHREKYCQRALSLASQEFLSSVGFYTTPSLHLPPTLFSGDDAAAVLDIYVYRTLWPSVVASALSVARSIMAAATGCSTNTSSFMTMTGSMVAVLATRGTVRFLSMWRSISRDLALRHGELRERTDEKYHSTPCDASNGVVCVGDTNHEITSSFGTRRLHKLEEFTLKENCTRNGTVSTTSPPSSPFWLALHITSPKNYSLLVRAISDIYVTLETEQELVLLEIGRCLTNSHTVATVADKCVAKNHLIKLIGQQHILPFLHGGYIHSINRYGSIVASASEISSKYSPVALQHHGNSPYSPILLAAGRDPYFLFWMQLFMDIVVKYSCCYSNGQLVGLLTSDTWLVVAEVIQLLYIHGAWDKTQSSQSVGDEKMSRYNRTRSWPQAAAHALYPETYMPPGTLLQDRARELSEEQQTTNDGGWFSGLWGSAKSPVQMVEETLFSVPCAVAPGPRISEALRCQEEEEAISRVSHALPSFEVLMKELPSRLLNGYAINDGSSITRSPFEGMLHAFCLVGATATSHTGDVDNIPNIDKRARAFVGASTANLIVEMINMQLILGCKGDSDDGGSSQVEHQRRMERLDIIFRNAVPYLRHTLKQQMLYGEDVPIQIAVSSITSFMEGLMVMRSIDAGYERKWMPIIFAFVEELTSLLEVGEKDDSKLLAVAAPLGKVLVKLLPLATSPSTSHLPIEMSSGIPPISKTTSDGTPTPWDKLLHTAKVVARVGSTSSLSVAHPNLAIVIAASDALIGSLNYIIEMVEQLADAVEPSSDIGVLDAGTLRVDEVSHKVLTLVVSLTDVSCSGLVLTMANNEPHARSQSTLNELNHICAVSVPSVLYRAEQLLLHLVDIEVRRSRKGNNSDTVAGSMRHWFPVTWLTIVNSLASIVTTIILGNSSNFVSYGDIAEGEAANADSDRPSDAGGIIVTLQRCCTLPFSLDNTSSASICNALLKTMMMTHMTVPNSIATHVGHLSSSQRISQQHPPCPPAEHLFNRILLPLVESICCGNSMNLLVAGDVRNKAQKGDSVENSRDIPQQQSHSFGSYLLPSVILSTVFGPMAGPDHRPDADNTTHERRYSTGPPNNNCNINDDSNSNTTTLKCSAISLLCRTYLECLIMLITDTVSVQSPNSRTSTFSMALFSGDSYKELSSPLGGPNTAPHNISTNTIISLWKSIIGLLYAIYTADDAGCGVGTPMGDQQQNSVVVQEAIEASITNVLSTVRMVASSQPSAGPAARIVEMFWQVSGVLLAPFPFYSAEGTPSPGPHEAGNISSSVPAP